jgi:imidazolonepropionase-like amidohydrolase
MLEIRGARLFDGETMVTNDPVLLVDGGKIAATANGQPPADATDVIDLGDVTLLPGLIDTHVHLAFDASPDAVDRLTSSTDDELLARMRDAASATLAAGVTTVRDLGDRNYLAVDLRDELATDPTQGPEILAAGPPITTRKGHCWFLGGEADGVEGMRAAVRSHAERGVDVVKVMASGGELTEGSHAHLSQYGLAELRAAVDEAHLAGLPVTAHAHAGQAIADAVAAGFDSIEHCSFMTEDGVEVLPEVVNQVARAGVAVSATLGIRSVMQPPPNIAARIQGFIAGLRQLSEAGVEIVCGTDAGIGPPKPHGILPDAVRMLVEHIGWPTTDALRAVTSVAAHVCRVGDRKGRLAPGFDADILAVAGDPLTDPAALLDVRAVFRAGQLVSLASGGRTTLTDHQPIPA